MNGMSARSAAPSSSNSMASSNKRAREALVDAVISPDNSFKGAEEDDDDNFDEDEDCDGTCPLLEHVIYVPQISLLHSMVVMW